jgi:serine-type D-Ala-D-Ala carboxypeptidase/endopeptidase (penicillin-binding protein 4)
MKKSSRTISRRMKTPVAFCVAALLFGWPAETAAKVEITDDSKVPKRPKTASEAESLFIGPPPPPRHVEYSPRVSPLLKSALHEILNEEVLWGVDVGFVAYDLNRKEVLAQTSPDLLINPASNVKLFTSAAAFRLLGPDYRWKTEYYTTGKLKNGVLYGDLVVKGYGDPSVVNERLQEVANNLYLAGLRRIQGRVVVDASYFDGVEEPKGWEMEEAPDRAYAAPVSALTLNYNSIGIHVRPGLNGEPAVVALDPPVENASVAGTIDTRRRFMGIRLRSMPQNQGTLVTVSGRIGHKDRPRRLYRRVYNPPLYFGQALVHYMGKRGIRTKQRVTRGTVPENARIFHIDRSPPLTKVISDLNHYSNNVIAETIVKTIGAEVSGTPGRFEAGLQAVRDFLEAEVGLSEGEYIYENGSGLNDVNQMTSTQMIKLLEYMTDGFDSGVEFKKSLAVAGTQGTIRLRMRHGVAERRLRGKTGTLRGVSALSGYVADPANEQIAFAILMTGYQRPVNVYDIWKIQNRLGEALASWGESAAPADKTDLNGIVLDQNRIPDEPAKGGAP